MEWYEELYAHVDQMDMEAVAGNYAEDVVMTMNNGGPVIGRANVIGALSGFQSTLAGLTHTFTAVAEQGNVTFLESSVKFDLWTGDSVELKGVTVYERRGELITAHRMYVDMAPVKAIQKAAERESRVVPTDMVGQ